MLSEGEILGMGLGVEGTAVVAGSGLRVSSIGESGGGGISVPSVRLKFMGARAGSSNRPLGLPFIGIAFSSIVCFFFS